MPTLPLRRLLVLILAAAALAAACRKLEPTRVALVDVTLVDPAEGTAREGMTVLVEAGRIRAVGEAAELEPPPGARRVDGEGRFLIPGLWDLHVHLAINPDEALAPERQLELYLAHGVVGVRDMGSDPERIAELRRGLREEWLLGPAIVSPGPYLDGPQDPSPAVVPLDDPEAARQAVHARAVAGNDFVKVQANLSREVYFAILETAPGVGLAVHGHVPDALTALEVAGSGQRTIEHLSPALPSDAGLFLSASAREDELRRELAAIAELRRQEGTGEEVRARTRALQEALVESYDPEKADELFAALRENGVRVVPTLFWGEVFAPAQPGLVDEVPLALLPPEAEERWRETWRGYFENAEPEALARNARLAQASRRLAGALHAAGVEVLAGTDSPFGPVLPGDALHRELELLVRAGLSPADVLRAATTGAAELLGLPDRGLEPGDRADLVLLAADPLADVENLRRIEAVLRSGVLYERADLDFLLEGSSEDVSE